ncbi:MAG: ATP:cob(I)alamin adenosyltransferase [Candidatus Thalassarchaeaceae archaeon]|jgi:cob(I)alamin adenosyltransferase|nr:ATP:cob(I)alamin adenosyltransferase [Candidatus Thalassarchaeaceae archaeon]
MVRITKVHTGGGDKGNTSLLSGNRVSKSHPRIELVGTIDELNSVVGLVRAELNRQSATHSDGGPRATVRKVTNSISSKLELIQQELFDIGAECACHPSDLPEAMGVIGMAQADRICEEMNEMLLELEPLESFVLPTGSPLVASIHLARTVTRRTERTVIKVRESEGKDSVRAETIAYLNRLSDWFFVSSRWITTTLGDEEILWVPIGKRGMEEIE